jgi:phenylalanyl-tRNA synthetase beta chain
MLISFNWLKKYVNLPDSVTPEEVAEKLKLATVEVEKIIKQGEGLDKILVGKIETVQAHPNADKLKICTVSFGEQYPAQVVCGGSHLKQGMLTAFAPLGAKVRWHGEGELIELQKATIRGADSHGMICQSTEIGLGEMFPLKDEKEILDFTSSKFKIGQTLAQVLGLNDITLEVDNKSLSNRPDLWGHYGLAWEVAALFNKKVKPLEIKKLKEGKEVDLKIKIEDKENCTRYIGAVVGGIKIGPSPEWLKQALTACGVKSINNVVDITNYVNWELGRPSHAFDRRDIKDDTIIVRRAKAEEKMVTLDGVERTLTHEMCLVCDAERPVDLGGIMGGLNSEIKDDTVEIILELANFKAANIRKTMGVFGLRTDAGVRFEKTLSPHLAELGLQRILTLLKEIIPTAHLISKIVDVNNEPTEQRTIEFTPEFFVQKVGVELDKKQIVKILESLGFTVQDKKEKLMVTLPLWRSIKDISLPEDLVEEIVRIYGYENVPSQLPTFSIAPAEENVLRTLERKIKNILSLEFNYTETYNYSFVSADILQKLDEDVSKHLELANPVAKDRPYLRRYLLPGLLLNAEFNLHRFSSVRLFEIGKVFHADKSGQRSQSNGDELLPQQNTLLSLIYVDKGNQVPFYAVSEAINYLLTDLGVEARLERGNHPHLFHNGRFAKIFVNDAEVGLVSEIDPKVQKKVGIDEPIAVAELDLDILLLILKKNKKYGGIPAYPEVVRDIAFLINKKYAHAEIVKALQKVDPLIVNVELFDVYEGKNVAEDKKSMAYHITYRSDERTLESAEVDKVQERVVGMLQETFAAEIRA